MKKVYKNIAVEDLLPRGEKSVLSDETRAFYAGKTVLVTGGGGSVGSEICRTLAECNPKQLIIFDIYENNAYVLEQSLRFKYGNSLNVIVEIGSVRDRDRLRAVFAAYKPDVVFHSAAHKHIPLMERCNGEAIKNNVFGTYNVADVAEESGVKNFILISTDKAVNPTNVMGASKRLCEMAVQCRTDGKTIFSAVRFGNVLGSNGSVIPLFKEQIMGGGPVTVTDKRVIRYFMTVSEAAQLAMQAGAMAKNGELFVLDMGKPVKIIDLAEEMIRLFGFAPYKDVEIKETGLRQGEKLYEELLLKTENLKKTENEKIFIERDNPLTREQMNKIIFDLKEAVEEDKNVLRSEKLQAVLKRAVKSYRSPEEVNEKAELSEEMRSANDK